MNHPGAVKSPSRIMASALALGLAFDLLFYGQLPGFSVLLFVLLALVVLFALGRMDNIAPRMQNLWLLVPVVFFAAMPAIRANPILNGVNLAMCVLLLALLAYFYSAGRLDRLGIVGYWLSLMISVFYAIFRTAWLIPEGIDVQRLKSRTAGRARSVLPLFRGLLLAFPIAIVFIALLASADAVFASVVASVFQIGLPDVQDALWHTVIVLSVAWIMAGGLAFALSRREAQDREPWEDGLDTIPRRIHIGFTESAVVLTVIDAIFLLFGWIQIAYLFGGPANITAEGYTYADYARRGFFELVAVSVLTMGLILGLQAFTWRETARQNTTFKALATLMIVMTCVLLASAFERMWLYEEAYGFTHLRLVVHVFEVWLAILFVWLLATLWAQPKRFAVGAFVTVLGFVATLNVLNLDSTIAERNFERYANTGHIDLYLLSELSEDAIPTIMSNAPTLTQNDQAWLFGQLEERLDKMKRDTSWTGIPSFNVARWQAYSNLEANSALLAQYRQTTPPWGSSDAEEPDYTRDPSGDH